MGTCSALPVRPARRNGAKSDLLDAGRAAREAVLREYLALPRRRGGCGVMHILLPLLHGVKLPPVRAIGQIKALLVNAPE